MTESLESAFHPRSMAIIGASGNPTSQGYRWVQGQVELGYRGPIYPVNPNYTDILGLKCYASIKDIPGSVDYVISSVPAASILNLLTECRDKGVKFVHLFTARFSETGDEDAIKLEREILKRAREFGIRLIGPNCLGIYYPKEGMALTIDLPPEPGGVGVFSQSGGNSVEIINYAAQRGIRFSKVISYGNALDLTETDFLEYLSQDPETKVIAAYVEGVKDGERFFQALKQATLRKPVIILKGGRGAAGTKAASSHTASLSGSLRVWQTAMQQAGAIQAGNMEELIDIALAAYFLPPFTGTRVGIVGGGGGQCVLSAGEWEEGGFNVIPLPAEIKEEVKKSLPELWWDWLGNPMDVSILPVEVRATNFHIKLMRMMALSPDFDLLVANITTGGAGLKSARIAQTAGEADDIIDMASLGKKPVVAILNMGVFGTQQLDDPWWRGLVDVHTKLMKVKIPVYSRAGRAANALIRLVKYYERRKAIVKP